MNRICALALAVALGGCAASTPTPGWDAGDVDRVLAELSRMEEQDPRNAQVKRDLGIALQQAGYPQRALAKLRTARELGADDALTYDFYARSADQAGMYDEALENYAAYLRESGRRPGVVLARMQDLSRAQARRELSRAVRAESALDADSLDPATVAVPRYANLAKDADLDPLGRGLALMLLTDLSRVDSLRVVEREKLYVLQEEMELARTPLVTRFDNWAPVGTTVGLKQRLSHLRTPKGLPYYSGPIDETRSQAFNQAVVAFQEDHGLAPDGIPGPQTQRTLENALSAAEPPSTARAIDEESLVRMGKLLAAGTVVMGSYTASGGERIELLAGVAGLTGNLINTDVFSGPVPEVLSLQKQLTFAVLEILGIPVTDALRRAIEPLPTRDFRAFLAYSRGLDYQARGMPDRAGEAFMEALERDPEFSLAREALDTAQADPEGTRDYSRSLLNRTVTPDRDAFGRLYRTGGWIGLGPGVVLDRDGDEDSGETATQKIEPARVLIEGDLPEGPP